MIRFSKYIWLYMLVSAFVIVPGVYTLLRYGLRQSIDFTGGTFAEVRFGSAVSRESVEKSAAAFGINRAGITQSTEGSYLFRLPPDSEEAIASMASSLRTQASVSADIVRLETVGPVLGRELLRKATIAAVVAIVGILLYVAYAFKNLTYGISAVVALAHDILVVVGTFALFGRWYGVEVDTLFVTAVLTTMSFSVHDTIVVFDRIREMIRKGEGGTFAEKADIALTQTMVRSLTNSFTIMFMLVALVLMGGGTTQWFVVALLIGTVSGTYSSPFIATPVLLLIHRLQERRRK